MTTMPLAIHRDVAGANRVIYVGVSTKMYLGYAASREWMIAVRSLTDGRAGLAGRVQLFVLPSFPVLNAALDIFAGSAVAVGAQTCAWGDGALTGEVSAPMLAELDLDLVMVGHAERRRLFGEDERVVALKTSAILDASMTPLLCIGEPKESDPEIAAAFCVEQLLDALGPHRSVGELILAYEPVWAIGQQRPAGAPYINAVIAAMRHLIRAATGDSAHVRIIYGGSAGPGLLPLLHEADGLFLGRFAHDPERLGLVFDEALAESKRRAADRNAL